MVSCHRPYIHRLQHVFSNFENTCRRVIWPAGRALVFRPLRKLTSFRQIVPIGGMISTGVWKKDKFGVSYYLRPAGDRVWAIKGYNFYFVMLRLLDVIYALKVNNGTDAEPLGWKTILTFSPNFFPLAKRFRVHVDQCLS
jgi:hypothetical protein